MRLARRLFRSSAPSRDDAALRCRLTRLKRLNRCYRDFLGLFLDAAEKQGEGFILDRQYVVSLVERAFRLGYEVVFHANVLVRGNSSESYALLDRLKAAARERLAGKPGSRDVPVAARFVANDEGQGPRPAAAAAGQISPGQVRDAREHRPRLIENAGVVAVPGVVSGRICTVGSDADLDAFPAHHILVARRLAPTAALLRTLPRVAAILVEEARPEDRLAVWARSFRIPTLLGVREVTRRLPPGELVTLDASDGVVYAGAFEELLIHHRTHGGSQTDDPEYRLLDALLWELGSPLFTTALGEGPGKDHPTLCDTVQRVHTTALCEVGAGLLGARENDRVPAPGFHDGVRIVDLSPGAGRSASGAPERGDPSDWILAGLGDAASRTPCVLYRWEESATALVTGGERLVWLDAFVVGEANHVMLWGRDAVEADAARPPGAVRTEAERCGLVLVEAPGTIAAWRERIPLEAVRDTVTRTARLARRLALGTGAVAPGPG